MNKGSGHSVNVHALAGFLDCISFDYFCTFTTRLPIGINTARRHAVKVYDHIKKSDSDASFFWAAEKFDTREGYHWHALLKADIDKYQVFDWYFQKYGRCQLIDNREPDRQLAASYYVSKYITKRLSDYDIYLSNSHRGLQRKINFNSKP